MTDQRFISTKFKGMVKSLKKIILSSTQKQIEEGSITVNFYNKNEFTFKKGKYYFQLNNNWIFVTIITNQIIFLKTIFQDTTVLVTLTTCEDTWDLYNMSIEYDILLIPVTGIN